MANELLTDNLSEPLGGATTAQVEIDCRSGNLTIDKLSGDEPLLARGTLQYFEKQGPPLKARKSSNGQITFTLKGEKDTGRPWLRLPWDACSGATEWQVHLNPNVTSVITAHSGGGNVTLDLSGMAVTSLTADTGGGNMDVVLPDGAANLDVKVKTGAGNVDVRVPSGIAARIRATSGLGKVIMDPRFGQIDHDTYQSSDYEAAANKIEITARSGAGNVSVSAK